MSAQNIVIINILEQLNFTLGYRLQNTVVSSFTAKSLAQSLH